jgi:hypothetical protein
VKKHLYPIIIIILATIFIESCKKDDTINGTRLIPTEMKAYWDFKPGTYWIYKDSTSGAFDSTYVTGYTNYTGNGTLNYTDQPITYEYLQMNTHSTLDSADYGYWINTQAGIKDYAPNGNRVFGSKSKQGGDYGTRNCFVYPIMQGISVSQGYGGPADTCIVRKIYTAYSGYSNVIEVDNTLNSFENYWGTKSFYVENIGLIRYVVQHYNKVRVLVRYHVVQ